MPGELGRAIADYGLRPDGHGERLDELVNFRTTFSDHRGHEIGFRVGSVAAGRRWLIGVQLKFLQFRIYRQDGGQQAAWTAHGSPLRWT